MSKFYKITLAVFIFLVAFLTYLQAVEPEPLNWNASYSASDKIPLGTYVLYDNLQDQFKAMERISVPPYEFLSEDTQDGTYLFINNQLQFDDDELNKLLNWVERGNTAFLASHYFSQNLLDTFDLEISALIPELGLVSKPMVNLVHPQLKREKAYLFDKDISHFIFSKMDTANQTVLGTSQFYSENMIIKDPEVNFIEVPHGEGSLFLNTTPQAFSNFFILHGENAEYIERALGFLPVDKVLYWDEFKKAGKKFQTAPLYILLGNRYLKWAYYFTLLGALLFVLFNGKRKQRAIPVVPPLENQTYNFTRTIAGLYLDRKDYKSIASKKLSMFLEYIRNHYRLQTNSINNDFYQNLAAQSGKTTEEVKEVFELINKLNTKEIVTKEELLALNSAIDAIKRK